MRTEEKLNLEDLRAAAVEARKEIATWPKWKRDAAREISYAAASEESRKVLYDCD